MPAPKFEAKANIELKKAFDEVSTFWDECEVQLVGNLSDISTVRASRNGYVFVGAKILKSSDFDITLRPEFVLQKSKPDNASPLIAPAQTWIVSYEELYYVKSDGQLEIVGILEQSANQFVNKFLALVQQNRPSVVDSTVLNGSTITETLKGKMHLSTQDAKELLAQNVSHIVKISNKEKKQVVQSYANLADTSNFFSIRSRKHGKKFQSTQKLAAILDCLSSEITTENAAKAEKFNKFCKLMINDLKSKHLSLLKNLFSRLLDSNNEENLVLAWKWSNFIAQHEQHEQHEQHDMDLAKSLFQDAFTKLTEPKLWSILKRLNDFDVPGKTNNFVIYVVNELKTNHKSLLEKAFAGAFNSGKKQRHELAWQCLNNLGAVDFAFAESLFKDIKKIKVDKVIRYAPESIKKDFWDHNKADDHKLFNSFVKKDESFAFAYLLEQGITLSNNIPNNVTSKFKESFLADPKINKEAAESLKQKFEKKSSLQQYYDKLPQNSRRRAFLSLFLSKRPSDLYLNGLDNGLNELQRLERVAREEQERVAREEQERLAREEQDRLAREEQDRLAREEQDRLAREEQDRLAREKHKEAMQSVIQSIPAKVQDLNSKREEKRSQLKTRQEEVLHSLDNLEKLEQRLKRIEVDDGLTYDVESLYQKTDAYVPVLKQEAVSRLSVENYDDEEFLVPLDLAPRVLEFDIEEDSSTDENDEDLLLPKQELKLFDIEDSSKRNDESTNAPIVPEHRRAQIPVPTLKKKKSVPNPSEQGLDLQQQTAVKKPPRTPVRLASPAVDSYRLESPGATPEKNYRLESPGATPEKNYRLESPGATPEKNYRLESPGATPENYRLDSPYTSPAKPPHSGSAAKVLSSLGGPKAVRKDAHQKKSDPEPTINLAFRYDKGVIPVKVNSAGMQIGTTMRTGVEPKGASEPVSNILVPCSNNKFGGVA